MSNETHTPTSIAFFDLDRTLIDLNSATLWVQSEWKQGYISTWSLTQAFWWLLQYHLGRSDLESALKVGIQHLAGQREVDFQKRSTLFYRQSIQHRFRPEGVDQIQKHRQQGDLCVLLTSSSLYLSQCVQEYCLLDAVLCTRFEVNQEGLFTGLPDGPLAFGSGKVDLAKSYAAKQKIDLKNCFIYTDSYSDLPILKAVGHPYVVCPDRRLARYASTQQWPILEWSTSS